MKKAGETTENVGFQPPGLKFKGNDAITTRQLLQTRAKLKIIKTKEIQCQSAIETGQNFSSSQNCVTARSTASKGCNFSQPVPTKSKGKGKMD